MNIYSCTIFESVCVASLRVVFFMFGMFATIGLLRHCYDSATTIIYCPRCSFKLERILLKLITICSRFRLGWNNHKLFSSLHSNNYIRVDY